MDFLWCNTFYSKKHYFCHYLLPAGFQLLLRSSKTVRLHAHIVRASDQCNVLYMKKSQALLEGVCGMICCLLVCFLAAATTQQKFNNGSSRENDGTIATSRDSATRRSTA